MRAIRAALLALLLPLGCSDSSGAADAGGHDADSGIVILGDLGPSVDASDAQAQPDLPVVCPSQCAKEFPKVPTCMKTSWDVKSCTCSLRPAEDGTPCDDGVACTGSDSCQAGECVGGGPAELLEPTDGWRPEGTPLLQPDNPDWRWETVNVAKSCKACDGSRAYLNWLTGLHDNANFWATATAEGHLVTMDLVARLRKYDAKLDVMWERVATELPGDVLTRRTAHDPLGNLYACGWQESGSASQQESSWVARYDADGILDWERTLPTGWRAEDVLPVSDGLYAITVGSDEIAISTYEAQLHRMTIDGEVLWTTVLESVHPRLGMPIRMEETKDGGAILAYAETDEQANPDQKTVEYAAVTSLARFDPSGTLVTKQRLTPPLHTTEVSRIAHVPGGRYLVVGTQWPTFEPLLRYPIHTWVVDEAGEVFTESSISTREKDYFRVQAAAEAPDGGVIVSGFLTYYTGISKPVMLTDFLEWHSDAFMLKLNRWGSFEWMRLFGGPNIDYAWDIVASTDGSFTLIGAWNYTLGTATTNDARSLLVRTDFWGRTCGMRLGVCADMPWQDCEDGNPCTINWCDPDQGCTHPPLPDGSPCDIGKTCQGAICK
ncbi:MAG: hypothetical protein H6744_14635 [Deltaproteobacteria bacterium]|nr:hypothetical protein [Deltaproteobacteria bacterium]